MRVRRLQVAAFGCIAEAEVHLGPGLNVLYGPNDLGKTTLASALRAVLLLQPNSGAAADFRSWHGDADPQATAEFEHDGRFWQVRKVWSGSTRRSAELSSSRDGVHFTREEEARGVDGRLRELLGWGVAAPGGKGGGRGLPRSFLASVLLGEQAVPYAVLDTSLLEDSEDSAKTKLRRALEAMAVDPLYERVLASSQEKVSEAFTDAGRRKQGKDSPFRRMTETIRVRQEELDHWGKRVHEADSVEARLQEVDGEYTQCAAQREQVLERVEALRRDERRASARAEVLARWQAAHQVLRELELLKETIGALETEVRTLDASRKAVDAAQQRATEAHAAAAQQVHEASAQCSTVASGGDPVQQLSRSRSEQRRTEMLARQRELEELAADVTACDAFAAQEQRAAAELERIAADHARMTEALTQEQAALVLWRQGLAWHRLRQAEAAASETERAAGLWEQERREAEAARADAEKLRVELAARPVPSRDVAVRLRALDRRLESARAALGGGLELRIALLRASDPRLRIDGVSVPCTPELTAEVQRSFELELPGVGSVQVRAGEREARAAADAAQRAWAEEAMPVLHAAGVADLAALEIALEQAESKRRDAEGLQTRAALIQARADARLELLAQREAREHAAAQRRSELSGCDLGALERHLGGASEEQTRASAEAAERRCESLRSALERRVIDRTRVAAEHEAARQQRLRQTERLHARLGDRSERPSVAQLQTELEATAARLLELERELQSLDEARSEAALRAQAALERTERLEAAARAELAAAQRRLVELDADLATRRGALAVHRKRLGDIDAMAAAEAFARVSDELERCPAPLGEVSPELLAAAEEELRRVSERLDAVERELRKQQGALQQIGGQVVRERYTTAREVFDAALHQESELELEYEAWRLLHTTLREVENEEGRHLGRALARHVGARLEALTAGRYSGIALGPELQTRGLQTRAGLKPVAALSEGLKEQIATLFRISVAEHVQGTLLLDDHLAQTDPARVAWFRELVEVAAQRIQIVWLTCRPLEYLDKDALPRETAWRDVNEHIRVVDLSRVIRRTAT